jgi:MFS family permease
MAGRRLLADLTPLRTSPAFRRLWLGSGLSSIGGQMTSFAVSLQVWTLTHSSFAVGAVALTAAVPAVVLGLLGGAVIDAVDRRRLVLLTSGCLAAVSALFAAQAYAGFDQLWPLYCLVALQSLLSAVDGPARRTFLPRLLAPETVPAGAALTLLSMHASVTVGPTLAGLLAGAWGLKSCYLIDAISFGAALYGVATLPPMPPEGGTTRPSPRAVAEGLRFVRGNRIVAGALLSDLNATVLGFPFALFPAINAAHFGGAAQTLGLLTAAPAVGGLLGSALSGPVGRVSRRGLGMLVTNTVWGATLAGFGLAGRLWLALLLLAVAGAADVTGVVFRTALVQLETPDRYRGRVSATEYVVGAACPQLGNFRAGTVAALTSPAVSAVTGGLATIAGAVAICFALPAFSRYRALPRPVAEPEPAET